MKASCSCPLKMWTGTLAPRIDREMTSLGRGEGKPTLAASPLLFNIFRLNLADEIDRVTSLDTITNRY